MPLFSFSLEDFRIFKVLGFLSLWAKGHFCFFENTEDNPFKTTGGFSQLGQPPPAVYVTVTGFSQRGQPPITVGSPHEIDQILKRSI